jgi:hypothetical protein
LEKYLIRNSWLNQHRIKKYLEAWKLLSDLDALKEVEPVAKPAKYSRLYFYRQVKK